MNGREPGLRHHELLSRSLFCRKREQIQFQTLPIVPIDIRTINIKGRKWCKSEEGGTDGGEARRLGGSEWHQLQAQEPHAKLVQDQDASNRTALTHTLSTIPRSQGRREGLCSLKECKDEVPPMWRSHMKLNPRGRAKPNINSFGLGALGPGSDFL
jgi:hypothetical protein